MKRNGALFTVLAAALLLGACAPSSALPDEAPEAGGHYPVTVDNCGFDLTVAAEPERIVTIKSTSTELVLALGAGERLVGKAFSDGEVPADLALPDPAPPVLSDSAPEREAVLAVEPDFVLGGWESNFTAENAGERDDLGSLGVATYVAPPACQGEGYRPSPLTFEHIFDYITEVGDLLGAPEQAEELVSEQRETLRGITPVEGEPTVVWYSSGSDIPYVGGGIGAPALLMETAGLVNINADVDEPWASVAWEAIADLDPDFLVLVDSAWNSVEHKIRVLEGNPVTASMSAVRGERYLVVDFPASEAGIRSVEAAGSLADQARDLLR